MPDGMYLDLPLPPSPLDDGPASEGGAGAVAAPPRTKVPKPLDFFMDDLRGFANRSGFEGCRTACESLKNKITYRRSEMTRTSSIKSIKFPQRSRRSRQVKKTRCIIVQTVQVSTNMKSLQPRRIFNAQNVSFSDRRRKCQFLTRPARISHRW